jgi:hypothetical protein
MACGSSQTLYNGQCYDNQIACPIKNGYGVQTFSNGGYSTCQLESCNSGYVGAFGTTCVPVACFYSAADVVATGPGAFTFTCPELCAIYNYLLDETVVVEGTDVYTARSNICAAAVHAGVLTPNASATLNIYTTGVLGGAFRPSTRNGVTSTVYGYQSLGYSFTVTAAESSYFESLWVNDFSSAIHPIDAQSLAYWAQDNKSNGCIHATGDFVRSGVPFNPWNNMSYIAGVQGVGPGNSSYNYGFITMTYDTVFGFLPDNAHMNTFLPMLDNGTLDAMGMANYFLGDTTYVGLHCSQFGLAP